jgi:hypothetical protein
VKKSTTILLLFSFIFIQKSYAQDLPEEEIKFLIDEIQNAKVLLTDEESEGFFQEILDDSSKLNDKEVKLRCENILHRVYIVRELDRILYDNEIVDPDKELLVQAWLDDPVVLDQPDTRNHAFQILEEIMERREIREKLVFMVKIALQKTTDKDTKDKLESWLENPKLLDDPEVQEELKKIVMQVLGQGEEFSLPGFGKMSTHIKIIKNLCLVAYAAYRKKRSMDAFDPPVGATSVEVGGFAKIFDHLAFAGYITTKEWEKYDDMTLMEYVNMVASDRPDKISKWVDKYRYFMENDANDFITKKIKEKVGGARKEEYEKYEKGLKKKTDDLEKNDSYKKAWFFWGKIRMKKKLINKEYKEYKKKDEKIEKDCGESVCSDVRRNGCQKKCLDLFNSLDYDMYKMFKKAVDPQLKAAGVSDSVREFIFSDPLRYIQMVLTFKFLPTYLYWKIKYNDSDAYINSKWRREALKSSENLLRAKLLWKSYEVLNGKKDKVGGGVLDRMKDKTLGLVGPNTLDLILDLTCPRALIKLDKKLAEKGWLQVHLAEDDYYGPNEVDASRYVPYEVVSYLGRNFIFHHLPHVFRRYRAGAFNWITGKAGGFLDFLSRRGWIDRGDWLSFKGTLQGNVTQLGGMVSMLLNLALSSRKEMRRMTIFDHMNKYNSNDMFDFMDTYLSFLIAERAGRWLAKKVVG